MDVFNTRLILTEKRYSWIDYDKGISIILVSYGHCLAVMAFSGFSLQNYAGFTYPGLFLYGFRMPLFFIISGVFVSSGLKRKRFVGYVYSRMNTILYPLFIWGIAEVSLQLISAFFKHKPFSLADYLYLITDPRRLGTGHFWYLNALFTIGAVYALLRSALKVRPVLQMILGFVLYCVAAYIHVKDLSAGILTDICEYYFFFALGDCLSATLLDAGWAARFASWRVFAPLLLVFVAVQYFVTGINLDAGGGELNFVEHRYPFLFLAEALVGCAFSVNVSFLLQKYNKARFLRVVGYHSLFIYVMQIIIMTATITCLSGFFKLHIVPLLIMLLWVVSVVAPMLIYNFCLRIRLWWLFTFKKPEREMIPAQTPNPPALTSV
jgi:fucose 4-O-acetylase-like acetyltransferase